MHELLKVIHNQGVIRSEEYWRLEKESECSHRMLEEFPIPNLGIPALGFDGLPESVTRVRCSQCGRELLAVNYRVSWSEVGGVPTPIHWSDGFYREEGVL